MICLRLQSFSISTETSSEKTNWGRWFCFPLSKTLLPHMCCSALYKQNHATAAGSHTHEHTHTHLSSKDPTDTDDAKDVEDRWADDGPHPHITVGDEDTCTQGGSQSESAVTPTIWECVCVCVCVCARVSVSLSLYQWQMQKALAQNCQLPWRWLQQRLHSDPVSAEIN